MRGELRGLSAGVAAALAMSAFAAVPVPAAAHGCAGARSAATAAPTRTMRRAVVCLINAQRSTRGLPALHASRRLNRSAQAWTDRMVSTGVFSHGLDFAARITAVGFIWQAAGENIATGYPTPLAVVRAWMASPDHCRNILDPSYRDVGTGVDRHPVGDYASGPASWTQDFALAADQSAPSADYGPADRCPY